MNLQLPSLKQVDNPRDEATLIEESLESARNGSPMRLLEAGCGQEWPLRMNDVHVTGLDLDPEALRIRQATRHDLDDVVVGDLATADLPHDAFDGIYCAFVLEHVPDARRVLTNFRRWVRPGGLVVVKVPDPDSVRGTVARLTPHWFHVWYWRHVIRYPHAGEPGYSPYPIRYSPTITRAGMRETCAELGFDLVVERGDARHFGDAPGPRGTAIAALVRAIAWVSGGRLVASHDNLLFVLRRRSIVAPCV